MLLSEVIGREKSPEYSKKTAKVPDYLIKETIDGIPFYYAGYRSVLDKTKTIEEIMADSGLQLFIKTYFLNIFSKCLDSTKFYIFIGEVGSHLDHRSNLGLDVAVYDKKILTPDKITSKYIDVIPKYVVEVDVKVEMASRDANLFEEFVLRKVKKLFAFGTETIVWVFSKSKTVIVARPDNKWDVLEWDQDIQMAEGIVFNIGKYLSDEGIALQD